MKRLLAALLLFVSPAVFAAARTASVTGDWNATATWGGAAVPTNADTCTINANITVHCTLSPCLCGQITNNGHLWATGTNYFRVGDGLFAGTTDSITNNAGGSIDIGAGQKIEFDTTSGASQNSTALLTNNGVLNVTGKVLMSGGTVSSFTEPSGDFATGTQVITDNTLRQPTLDYYSGKIFVPTSGFHRWQPFTITTGATTKSQIVLLAYTRGAYDSRNLATDRLNPTAWMPGDWGEIYSTGTATVAAGGTVVTGGGGASWTSAKALGARFACNGDLGSANDTDIRTVCSVDSATQLTLCSAYGPATCAAGAAYRIFDDNQPPFPLPIVQSFSEGDGYLIYDPAILTVVAGNQSNTAQDGQFRIVINSGSTTNFTAAEIGWCGQDKSGALQLDCLTVNQIDNTQTSEQFTFDLVDMHHWSGHYGMSIVDGINLTFRRFAERDAAEGGGNGGGEAHGTAVEDASGNGRVANIVFEDFRIVRANDDAFSWTTEGEAADNVLCTGCKIRRGVVGFIPSNGGGSVEGFEPGKSLIDFEFTDNFMTNVESTLFALGIVDTASDLTSMVVTNNVISNSQLSGLTSTGTNDASDPTNANWRVVFVGNYLRGGTVTQRGTWYSNYVDFGERGTQHNMEIPQGMYGNIILGPPLKVNNSATVYVETSTTSDLLPSTVTIQDNAVLLNQSFTAANQEYAFKLGTTTTSPDFTFSHNSIFGQEATAGGTAIHYVARTNGPAGKTHTFTNNIFANDYYGIYKSAGSHTVTSNYNLFWRITVACPTGCTGANDLITGTTGLFDPLSADFNVAVGATPWTSLGSDGYLRGARVAGPPNIARLRRVYPFLPQFTVINNIDDVDTDGDGVWNLHDNCDTKWNPTQTDTDADGIGDACDP